MIPRPSAGAPLRHPGQPRGRIGAPLGRAGARFGHRAAWVAASLVLLAACPSPAVGQAPRKHLDVKVFARVPSPGQPEPIAIGPDGNVYVGTNQLGRGDGSAPSQVLVFAPDGRLARRIVLRGQKLDEDHGIQGLAFDGDGLLYALDRAHDPRVVVIDPATGRQADYARFRNVPSCGAAGRRDECSATVGDSPAEPDYGAFGADGSLYVSDIEQALIWRVPPGGGRPEVWFTDPLLENVFGPNGVQFMADGTTLMIALTAQSPAGGNPTVGRLLTLAVRPDGRPGELRTLWESRPLDGPDGFALARSGNAYVALAGASQLAVISPRGQELARVPATPLDNAALEVPFDGPGSVAFLDRRVLVTNHSPIAGNPASWAVLDVFAGEPGLPLHHPRMAPPPLPKAGRSCLPSRLRFRPGRLTGARFAGGRRGGLRLGAGRAQLSRRAGVAPAGRRGPLRWCVSGGGRVTAVLSRRGRARLIASTGPRHRARAVRVGASTAGLRRAFPRARVVATGLYADAAARLAFGVRAGRVRWLAAADRRLLTHPRALRAYARRAGLAR